MSDIHISFYLRVNRIHISSEALRCIGRPKRICLLMAKDGQSLLIRTHENRDFKSHKVPQDVYRGERSFEISSYQLCRLLAGLHGWDPGRSYRVPGVLVHEPRMVRFSLSKADVTGGKGK